MNRLISEDLGKLVLRFLLAVLLLFHGIHKMMNGLDGIPNMLSQHDLPSALAYAVFLGEILAPVLLIIGVGTRIAGALVAISMGMAIFLVHTQQLFLLNTETGGYMLELQAFYFFSGIIVMLLGAGRYSFGGANGRWN